jgi:hypothetical protein
LSLFFWLRWSLLFLVAHIPMGAAQTPPSAGPTTLTGWGDNEFNQSTVPADLGDVVSIAAGRHFTLALRADGSVVGWGSLGEAWTNLTTGLTDVIAVDAFYGQGLLLRANGTVLAINNNGEPMPGVLADVTNAIAIAAGGHALALRADGTVATSSSQPSQAVPAGLSNVVAISAGVGFSVALTGEGRVVAWGDNDEGQIEVPPNLTDVVAIDAGWNFVLALRSNGAIVSWGNNNFGQRSYPVLANTKSVAICAGTYHSVIVWDNRMVWVGGRTHDGMPAIPRITNHVVQVSAGPYNTFILSNDGRPYYREPFAERIAFTGSVVSLDGRATGAYRPVYEWRSRGEVIPGATNAVLTLTNLSAADAGSYTITASHENGQAVKEIILHVEASPPILAATPRPEQLIPLGYASTFSWVVQGSRPMNFQWFHNGVSVPAATNVNLNLPKVTRALRGHYVLQASNALGVLFSPVTTLVPLSVGLWGNDFRERTLLSPGMSNLVDIACDQRSNVGLTDEGTLFFWGETLAAISNAPPAATNLSAIAMGDQFVAAVTAAGTILQWGKDIGSNHVTLSNVVAVAAGRNHGLALLTNGQVRTFGVTESLQLADVPGHVTNIVAIACGFSSNFALDAGGRVWAWGVTDGANMTNVPANLEAAASLSVGGTHVLILQENGEITGWGSNSGGQANVPPDRGDVVSIANLGTHSFALRRDGSVVSWGDNTFGQRNLPANLRTIVRVKGWSFFTAALLDDNPSEWYSDILMNPTRSEGGFTFVVQSRRGSTYWLESAASADAEQWIVLQGRAGNGSLLTFMDSRADNVPGSRFYRLRRR